MELAAKALRPITAIADELGLEADEVEQYGRHAAKIQPSALDRLNAEADGKLVCVTAVTPTKAGEGKTTSAISLVDALCWIGEQAVLCLREPSLGPVFGIKGGGTGGGRAQISHPSSSTSISRETSTGLPSNPAAPRIDLQDGAIRGLR